jgi:hypothetical protein
MAMKEQITGLGCTIAVVAFPLAAILFVAAASLPPDSIRNVLYGGAFLAAVVGGGALAVAKLLEDRRSREMHRALLERARRRRRERQQQRELAAQEAPSGRAHQAAVGEPIELPRPPAGRTPRAQTDLGICPLCHTQVLAGEEYRQCPACERFYHSDCWIYNEGCAVFGCAGARGSD